MVDLQTDKQTDKQSERDESPPGLTTRRRWLYAAVGVVLAACLAAVLLSTRSNGPAGRGGLLQSGSPDLPGVDANTASLLSLSSYPQQSKPAPDFLLTDQNGQPVSLSQFRGKTVVLSFNDDQCTDVCTLLAEDVVRADQYLGPAGASQVVFLSVNVNPFFPETPYVKQWSDHNDLGHISNWYFGTGPVPTLKAIWKEYGVYVSTDPTTQSVTHSALIEFIGPTGVIRASADFGQNAVDVAPYSHGMAQVAVDLLPASKRTPVAGPQAPNPTGTGAGIGQHAPDFQLPTLTGPSGNVSLASLAGRPVVLNFWASTCTDCRSELAAFAQIAAADPNIQYYGIDVADPSLSSAVSLARSAGIGYPLLADRDGKVAAAYKITGLPTTIYIDPSGHVAVVHPGAMTEEQLHYTLAQYFPSYTPAGD